IATWAIAHPNIAAVQSYHNNGGMILRGPGAKADPPYSPIDLKTYDLLGKEGERLLPGYHYYISWKDLYTVHGATTDHFYNLMGALAFTNEMYNPPADFDKNGEVSDEELMKFNDLLSLGRQWIDWHPYNHPQYGPIDVGGFKRDVNACPRAGRWRSRRTATTPSCSSTPITCRGSPSATPWSRRWGTVYGRWRCRC